MYKRQAIALYENGQCSKTEAERLLAFCNNSGPAFILGVVGTGIFASSRAGLLLYLAHIAASLCVGPVSYTHLATYGVVYCEETASDVFLSESAWNIPVSYTHLATVWLDRALSTK